MKILGIGNAIVDVICRVNEDFLTKNNLAKSTMKLVDEKEFKHLLSDLNIERTIAGGSVANSIVGLSQLKNEVSFIGKVSNDKLGNEYEKSLTNEKVKYCYNKKVEQTPKDKRTVTESKIDVAWKIDDKFIIPECFDYVWNSRDKYETFFDEYIEKLDTHREDPRFKNFIVEIGTYLNNEVPINHSIETGWEEIPYVISLSRQLDSCMSDKPETEVMIDGDYAKSEFRYEVVEAYSLEKGKELAPHIKQDFEGIKKVDIAVWGGGVLPVNRQVTFGLLTIDGKKVLLPLKNHIKY